MAFLVFLIALIPGLPSRGLAFPVWVSSSPEVSRPFLISTIQSAQQTLKINIYNMAEPSIADAIEERIDDGVEVEVLLEGSPVGGRSDGSREIQARLVEAMRRAGKGKFSVMIKQEEGKRRRFRFNHAKYIVVDEQILHIGSENYTPTGHPAEGEKGNRGWQAVLKNSELSSAFLALFQNDTDLSYGDVVEWRGEDSVSECPIFSLHCASNHPTWSGVWLAALPRAFKKPPLPNPSLRVASNSLEAQDATMIQSPETSLSGLLQMIRGARKTLDLELMTFGFEWKKAKMVSPLLAAILDALKRNPDLRVRILLNDDRTFLPPGSKKETKNWEFVRRLKELTVQELSPKISARIGNLERMGVSVIHNKGALVDGTKTLISSINWNENSVQNNRETAVLVESPEVNAFYSRLFEEDWRVSR